MAIIKYVVELTVYQPHRSLTHGCGWKARKCGPEPVREWVISDDPWYKVNIWVNRRDKKRAIAKWQFTNEEARRGARCDRDHAFWGEEGSYLKRLFAEALDFSAHFGTGHKPVPLFSIREENTDSIDQNL